MAGPKTALGDAIGLGISLFDESDAPTRTIIALTDGNGSQAAVDTPVPSSASISSPMVPSSTIGEPKEARRL